VNAFAYDAKVKTTVTVNVVRLSARGATVSVILTAPRSAEKTATLRTASRTVTARNVASDSEPLAQKGFVVNSSNASRVS
jgi:hypothetical protein